MSPDANIGARSEEADRAAAGKSGCLGVGAGVASALALSFLPHAMLGQQHAAHDGARHRGIAIRVSPHRRSCWQGEGGTAALAIGDHRIDGFGDEGLRFCG
jgi:hypothetical protein